MVSFNTSCLKRSFRFDLDKIRIKVFRIAIDFRFVDNLTKPVCINTRDQTFLLGV